MTGRPEPTEAAPYYYTYINKVESSDILSTLDAQLPEVLDLGSGISEEKSLHRYAPGKWTIREVLNHINDSERAFVFRALWFARGFDTPLPGYDQEISSAGAKANDVTWAAQVEEFRYIRQSTIAFFRNLPGEAWMRTGIASEKPFTVRSLAYITAGHVAHHLGILRERYL